MGMRLPSSRDHRFRRPRRAVCNGFSPIERCTSQLEHPPDHLHHRAGAEQSAQRDKAAGVGTGEIAHAVARVRRRFVYDLGDQFGRARLPDEIVARRLHLVHEWAIVRQSGNIPAIHRAAAEFRPNRAGLYYLDPNRTSPTRWEVEDFSARKALKLRKWG